MSRNGVDMPVTKRFDSELDALVVAAAFCWPGKRGVQILHGRNLDPPAASTTLGEVPTRPRATRPCRRRQRRGLVFDDLSPEHVLVRRNCEVTLTGEYAINDRRSEYWSLSALA